MLTLATTTKFRKDVKWVAFQYTTHELKNIFSRLF